MLICFHHYIPGGLFPGKRKAWIKRLLRVSELQRQTWAFPLTFFLNLGDLLFFLCLLFIHYRKIARDLPPWMIMEKEHTSHTNTIEHFPIEYVRPTGLDISWSHREAADVHYHIMEAHCSWGDTFSFYKQSSCACGISVSRAKEHCKRLTAWVPVLHLLLFSLMPWCN